MDKNSKIYVAGHRGLVGSAIVNALQKQGYSNLTLKTRQELNLLDSVAVKNFFENEKPDYVFLAAAKVGGILANSLYSADFIYENLMIQNNIIHQSYENKVKKLLFLGSSCIYPKLAPQPLKEEYMLTGPLESTNDAYALAKITGIKMCQAYHKQYGCNFISVMPTNMFGPGDNYDLKTAHALPAMIRRFHEAKGSGAKQVEIWGTGTPKREFMYSSDLADACLFLMEKYDSPELINIGTGIDCTILELAQTVKKIVGYTGEIVLDKTKPDGTPRKWLDVSKINALGWKAKISLEDGIKMAYTEFQKDLAKGIIR
jgi:GDP-L-fucose synthase